MIVLKGILLTVLILSSISLIGLILLQRSKSEGLGLAFGASTGESLFGARAGNVLSKATVVLGVAFMAAALILGVLYAKQDQSLMSTADSDSGIQTLPLNSVNDLPFSSEQEL
tara:strand:+ start:867 stop:1205 length:339 start_codon:yes stop_codon:yes gene_type:complete